MIKHIVGAMVLISLLVTPAIATELRQVKLMDETNVLVSEANPLEVRMRPLGMNDTNNSTSTPLLAGITFTGDVTDISEFVSIAIKVDGDAPSATDGLKIYYSADGVSGWSVGEEYTYLDAGTIKYFSPPAWSSFYYITYTNGGSDQTTFDLSTKISTAPMKWSSHNIAKAITGEDDAELVKAVSTGLAPDGTYKNVLVTNAGNQKISLEEYEVAFDENPLPVTDQMLTIAQGNRIGAKSVNKYGRAMNGIQLTATDIWDRADATPTQQIWLAPTDARIHTIVSSSTADDGTPEGAGAGAQAVRIYYLPDWDTVEAVEDVILNGTAGVAMQNAAVIIHRMKVIPVGTTYAVNVGNITATAAVDSTITAQISIGYGQTNMAIYGIPSTQTAYMTGYDVGMHTAGTPASPNTVNFSFLVNEYPNLSTTAFINKGNDGAIATGNSRIPKKYAPYVEIAGPAIIKFQAIATVADTEADAKFDLILVDN